MRSMIIRGDQITQADMDKETPLMRQQAGAAAAPEEAAAEKTEVAPQESQS